MSLYQVILLLPHSLTDSPSPFYLSPPPCAALFLSCSANFQVAQQQPAVAVSLSGSDSFEVLCDFTLLARTLLPLPFLLRLLLLCYAYTSSLLLSLSSPSSSSLSLSLSVSSALCPQLYSFDVVLHMLAKSFCIADVPQSLSLLSLMALQLVS